MGKEARQYASYAVTLTNVRIYYSIVAKMLISIRFFVLIFVDYDHKINYVKYKTKEVAKYFGEQFLAHVYQTNTAGQGVAGEYIEVPEGKQKGRMMIDGNVPFLVV